MIKIIENINTVIYIYILFIFYFLSVGNNKTPKCIINTYYKEEKSRFMLSASSLFVDGKNSFWIKSSSRNRMV